MISTLVVSVAGGIVTRYTTLCDHRSSSPATEKRGRPFHAYWRRVIGAVEFHSSQDPHWIRLNLLKISLSSKMKKKLILHIGMHKTGTSSIQNFFEKNRQRNLEDYRLYYPKTDRKPLADEPRHLFLSAAVLQHRVKRNVRPITPTPRDLVRELAEEIYGMQADLALLSAEGMSAPIPEMAEEYAAFGEYFDVSVLVILRRQDLFAEALHGQLVRKQRETRSLAEFLDDPEVCKRLDYFSMISNWETAFGRRAIHVLLYEQPLLEAGLIESIFNHFEIPIVGPLVCERINASPGREMIELLRHINRSELTQQLPVRKAHLRNRLLMKLICDLGLSRNSTRILGREARHKLLATYQEGNAEIAVRYLARTDGLLFVDDTDDGTYPEEPWSMPEHELVEALTQVTGTLGEAVMECERIRALADLAAALCESATKEPAAWNFEPSGTASAVRSAASSGYPKPLMEPGEGQLENILHVGIPTSRV